MKKNIFKILPIAFALLAIGLYLVPKEKRPKNITLIFRYDDPSIYTSTKLEKQILDIFKEYNLSVTFGLIPYRCSGNPIDTTPQEELAFPQRKIDIYKSYIEDGTLEIALHGYSHQTSSTTFWSEFQDVPYTVQYDKLWRGKKLLEQLIQRPIYAFVPPYNTYDLKTIDILEKLHFLILSANNEAPAPKDATLSFISNTTTIDNLDTAIKNAVDNDTITVMFHEYNFSKESLKGVHKSYISLEDFDVLLNTLQEDKNISILSLHKSYNKTKKIKTLL